MEAHDEDAFTAEVVAAAYRLQTADMMGEAFGALRAGRRVRTPPRSIMPSSRPRHSSSSTRSGNGCARRCEAHRTTSA